MVSVTKFKNVKKLCITVGICVFIEIPLINHLQPILRQICKGITQQDVLLFFFPSPTQICAFKLEFSKVVKKYFYTFYGVNDTWM